MTGVLSAQILRLVDEFSLTRSGFRLCGENFHFADESRGRDRQHLMRRKLASWIYVNVHCQMSDPVGGGSVVRQRDFVDQLMQCVPAQYGWDVGWRLLADEGGRVVVEKEGLRIYSTSDRVSRTDGSLVALRVDAVNRNVSPGFTSVFGAPLPPAATTRGMDLRFYWNVRADGATSFLRSAVKTMNAAGLYYRLKCLSDPAEYVRTDAAVLYACSIQAEALRQTLVVIHRSVAEHLKPATSPFALRLSPGLAAADEPLGDMSFGQHVSWVLAGALINGGEGRGRIASVDEACRASGLRLCFPYHLRENSPVMGLAA